MKYLIQSESFNSSRVYNRMCLCKHKLNVHFYLIWVPATPTKYGFVCSLFGSRHSLINLDPDFVYNFLSSVLSFTLDSSGRMCSINASPECLALRTFSSRVSIELE